MSASRKKRQGGGAVIEFSLLGPWLLFMFIGLLDCGFFTNALIATENAARVGALASSLSAGSAGNAASAWPAVIGEMRSMPNVNGSATCAGPTATCTDAGPLTLTVASVTGPDGFPASRATVQYTTIPLIPLPFLPGQLAITRQAVARVIPE